MLPEIPAEQLAAALDDCAAEVLAAAEIVRPPVDAFRLAERLGLVVARDGASPARGRLVRLHAGGRGECGTVLLADEERPERRHWALAHEIGESVAYRVFAHLGINPAAAPPATREQVANHLASCLLLPRSWFVRCGRRVDWDLLELKEHFSTASYELIARRMLEMPPPAIVTLFDQGRLRWRRSNVLRCAPRLSDAEMQTWQAAHESGQPSHDNGQLPEDGIESIRCWPIHEPEWRREILRTELTEVW